MSYFDIDDILCEEQTLKSKFLASVPWKGRFFGSEQISLIDSRSVYELPFWMAAPLVANHKIDISLPWFYGQRVREELLMSPQSVRLGVYCTYFHLFATKLMAVLPDSLLYSLILSAFSQRFPEIIRHSQNTEGLDRPYLDKLDHTEKKLFAGTFGSGGPALPI